MLDGLVGRGEDHLYGAERLTQPRLVLFSTGQGRGVSRRVHTSERVATLVWVLTSTRPCRPHRDTPVWPGPNITDSPSTPCEAPIVVTRQGFPDAATERSGTAVSGSSVGGLTRPARGMDVPDPMIS